MFGSPLARVARARILAGLMVLATGGGGGAVLGIIDDGTGFAQTSSSAALAAAELPERFDIGALVVQESPQPQQQDLTAPAAPVVRRVVKVRSPKPAGGRTAAAATITMPSAASGSATCDRLNDRMVEWLRRLVAKTRDANPGTEAIASQLDGQLAGALGKNLCVDEAQAYFTAMCADGMVRDFMHKMVKELPFFVRPLVGDPCTHDLVEMAQKYLP
jgi:hypothetical protein